MDATAEHRNGTAAKRGGRRGLRRRVVAEGPTERVGYTLPAALITRVVLYARLSGCKPREVVTTVLDRGLPPLAEMTKHEPRSAGQG